MSKFDIFNEVNLGHNSNICLIFSTEEVLKWDISKVTKFLQLLNIFCISITFKVLKFSTLIIVNFLQDSNIFLILVTNDTSKWDTFKFIRFLQLLNIYSILVTLVVTKLFLLKEIDSSLRHCSNILPIFFTFCVWKLDNTIEVKVSQFLNIDSISLTFEVFIFFKSKDVNKLQ